MPVSFATHFRLFKDCRLRYERTEVTHSLDIAVATGFSKIPLSRSKSSTPTRTSSTSTPSSSSLRFRFVTVIVSAVRGSPGLNFSDGGQVALVVTVTKWERGEFGGKYERASMEGGNVNRFIQGSAIGCAPGCVNPAYWLPLVAGRGRLHTTYGPTF